MTPTNPVDPHDLYIEARRLVKSFREDPSPPSPKMLEALLGQFDQMTNYAEKWHLIAMELLSMIQSLKDAHGPKA